MKFDSQIDESLEQYSNAVRTFRDAGAGRSRARDWARYTAAAGSALGLASAAEASVVYSGVQNLMLVRGTGNNDQQTLPLDVDGIGPDEFLFRLSYVGTASLGYAAVNAFGSVGFVVNGNDQPRRLSSGNTIGTSQTLRSDFFGRFRDLNGGTTIAGTWPGGNPTSSSGFAGFFFNEGGDTHFGWLRLRIRNDSSGLPDKMTLVDWAYETTDNASIQAGQVPEPSSFALLAAGFAGLAAYRRRQKTQH